MPHRIDRKSTADSRRVTARPTDGPVRADRLAAALPTRAWNRLSAGPARRATGTTTGPWIAITPPDGEAAGHHWLIRRRISDGELAFYRCWSPHPVPLRALVTVAERKLLALLPAADAQKLRQMLRTLVLGDSPGSSSGESI